MEHYHCCVPLCNNDQRKSSATGKNLKFFNFPKDGQLRKAWIIAIRRDEGPLFKIEKDSTLVCSEHFKTDEIQTTLAGRKRLRDQAVPSVFAWTKTTQQRPENVFQRRKKLRFEKNASSSVNSEPTAEEQLKNHIAQLEEQKRKKDRKLVITHLPGEREKANESDRFDDRARAYERYSFLIEQFMTRTNFTNRGTETVVTKDRSNRVEDARSSVSGGSRKSRRSSRSSSSRLRENAAIESVMAEVRLAQLRRAKERRLEQQMLQLENEIADAEDEAELARVKTRFYEQLDS
ncbi:hypothetical protein ACROYT_G013222 [Oculina patagonica]